MPFIIVLMPSDAFWNEIFDLVFHFKHNLVACYYIRPFCVCCDDQLSMALDIVWLTWPWLNSWGPKCSSLMFIVSYHCFFVCRLGFNLLVILDLPEELLVLWLIYVWLKLSLQNLSIQPTYYHEQDHKMQIAVLSCAYSDEWSFNKSGNSSKLTWFAVLSFDTLCFISVSLLIMPFFI